MNKYEHNRGRRFEKTSYNTEEVRRLVDAIPGHGICAIRNRAFVWMLYATGARISETLALELHDLETFNDLKRIHIRNGKASGRGKNAGLKRERYAYMAIPKAEDALMAWLHEREIYMSRSNQPIGAARDGKSYLFCTLQSEPMKASYFNREIPKWGKLAGLGRVHPHGLRRSHAMTLMHDHKASMVTIQAQLGHSSIHTTELYLESANRDRKVQEEMNRIFQDTLNTPELEKHDYEESEPGTLFHKAHMIN